MKKIHENREEYLKNYRKQNKEKMKKYCKIWYQKNKDKVLKKTHDYYLKNLDKKTAYYKKWREETQYNKKYYTKNKEYLNKASKEYHIKNRETLIKKMRERYDPIKRREDYLKNRDTNLSRVKEWRIKNAEYVKQYRKEFEARPERKAYHKQWNKANPKKSHGGSYPLELEIAMNNVRLRDNNTCQWQGCGLSAKQGIPIHVHHIFPRSEYPELQLEEQYMLCYCLNHHYMWHMYRGDQCANILKANIRTIQESDLNV